jgi:Na+-transporting methylmalonyl-CoA/oxaloacetate decarboxylase gamma subunit
MAARVPHVRVTRNGRRAMNTVFTVVVLAFVLAVLAVVAYAVFEMGPFARHADTFRDPRTGKRRGESPHLE